MKTKTLLTYGAIAAGAYLAYRFLNAEIKGKRFAMKPKSAAASFTGNEDSSFYQKFTGNEDSKFYNQFSGTIAVNNRGANPVAVKQAVRANLLRRKGF